MFPHACIVNGGHNGLPSTSRGHEQVPVVTLLACQRNQLKETLLEGFWTQFKSGENKNLIPICLPLSKCFLFKLVRIINNEIITLPVAFKDRNEPVSYTHL